VNIVAKHDVHRIVFVGDYFDAKEEISAEYQQLNFADLVAFKRKSRDKVVLLLGNHDYYYLKGVTETYVGFQKWQKTGIQSLLHGALDDDLLQTCFAVGNIWFSHAGVTKTWLRSAGYSKDVSVEWFINDLFRRQPSMFWLINRERVTAGDASRQSPICVRPHGLVPDMPGGYMQVIGHTPQSRLTILPERLALIDTVGTSSEYLYINDGRLSALPVSNSPPGNGEHALHSS
jgi:hypothetical protein